MSRRAVLATLLWLSAIAGQCIAAAPPRERLIVANSYIAEIVVALGAAGQVVGVGGGSEHIGELAGVPRLPGFRQSSAEPLLALGPQRVVMSEEWVVPQTVAQLRAAGVAVDLLDGEQTPDGVERRIVAVARILGREPQGAGLVAKFRAEMAAAQRVVRQVERRPRALFILAGGSRPTLVGGRGTNAAALLELAGAVNVAAGIDGFKVMSQESMIEAAPDFILTNSDGLASQADGRPVAFRAPGAAATPAAAAGRLISIPGEYLQGMGLLTPKAVTALARQLHPGLP